VPAAAAVALFALPLLGLLGRAPWGRLGTLLTEPTVTEALRLSLVTSVLATAASVVLGVPLAWLLSRVAFPGKRLVRALVTLPMVLPPVVGGTALLLTLGRRGLLGGPLADATGLVLPFSLAGVVVANTFVALPFLVVTVEGALDGLDRRHEAAAATLGAGPLTVFRRVTLPMIGPSLRAGMVLAWARALGEFGATITFAGNFPGTTQTMPLAVYLSLETNPEEAIVLALVMIAISFGVLLSLRDRWFGAVRRPMQVAAA
jgi:molybdate transport system permease protein